MKFKLSIICSLFLAVLLITGCSEPEENEATYRVEIGAVSKTTFQTAWNKLTAITVPSYSAIYQVRVYLYNNTLSDHATESNVPESEIKDLMISRGFSNYETSSELNFLKQNGNDIVFFEHASDSNKMVWMYLTK